jgi:hypothetical protein
MEHVYVVCENCGHTETIDRKEDLNSKCENCRWYFGRDPWMSCDLGSAMEYSDTILYRNAPDVGKD